MLGQLELNLLGKVEFLQDGALVTGFRSSKARALLCYLAITRQRHLRPTLTGLLWGDVSEPQAKASLRQTLTNLRKLVGSHLEITRHSVAFDRTSPYELDVELFEAGVLRSSTGPTLEPLQQAVELYQGDFMAGFYVKNAPEFEEWVLTQRTRLRHLVLQALYRLLVYYIQQGESGRANAIDYAMRLLALDPWREEVHRHLMLLLALDGQRSAALALAVKAGA